MCKKRKQANMEAIWRRLPREEEEQQEDIDTALNTSKIVQAPQSDSGLETDRGQSGQSKIVQAALTDASIDTTCYIIAMVDGVKELRSCNLRSFGLKNTENI